MRKTILIVDDDSATLFGLRALFETPQVEVLTAISAQAAKAILRSRKVDVVLSDVRLSGTMETEGLDLLKFAAAHCPGTRTIMMTGYGDAVIMELALELGASFYFEKPLNLADLGRAMGHLGVPLEPAGNAA
jgi:DNA-binding NtrC family response regulator